MNTIAEFCEENSIPYFTRMKTCAECGHIGNVHEYPFYSAIFRRDTTEYLCDDHESCLNRRGFYPSSHFKACQEARKEMREGL